MDTATKTIEQTAEELVNLRIRDVRVTFNDGRIEKLRIFKSTCGDLCYLAPRRHNRGYHLPFSQIQEIIPVLHRKSKENKWEDGWKKVVARLQKSGLWSNLVEDINMALKVGYAKMQQASEAYWKIAYKDGFRDEAEFCKQFPEVTYTNSEGKLCINTSIVWNYSKLPRVKKMRFHECRFGKSMNDADLEKIAKAMKEKKDCSIRGRAAYDVTFEYKAAKNVAWYSEEFRGCGNGHYYLAIDEAHALFVEDD